MIAQLLVLLAIICVASSTLYYEDHAMQAFQWSQFKSAWGKRFQTAEEDAKRFKIFIENIKNIDKRNAEEAAANGTAVHGITRFSDLTHEEFRRGYLNIDASKVGNSKAIKVTLADSGSNVADWAGKYTTPVKDQAYCGSCWAFSATEQIESDSMRVLGTNFILAPQQIVSCDPVSQGCNGGWPYWAFDYVMSANGQEQEADYPYTSGVDFNSGTCKSDASKEVMSLTGYFQIDGKTAKDIETAMATYVGTTGPLSICVDANNWSSYTGGIMKVCGQSIDHAVQMVGVNTDEGYWKVRNSWGTSWGESGYIRLAYGANTCAITYQPLYTQPALPTK